MRVEKTLFSYLHHQYITFLIFVNRKIVKREEKYEVQKSYL